MVSIKTVTLKMCLSIIESKEEQKITRCRQKSMLNTYMILFTASDSAKKHPASACVEKQGGRRKEEEACFQAHPL